MALSWTDNQTVSGLTVELAAQWLFWFIFIRYFRDGLEKHLTGIPWFERLATMKGGKSEWLSLASAIPQHALSALLLWLAMYLKNPHIFAHGVVVEWAYEAVDIVNQTVLFVNGKMDPQKGPAMMFMMCCHHLPGIIAIPPGCIFLAADPDFQAVVFSLLGFGWMFLTVFVSNKTLDLQNLGQRTQFATVYSLNLAWFAYQRFYIFPLAMKTLVFNIWSKLPLIFVVLSVLYGIALTVMNTILVLHLSAQLIKLMSPDEKGKVKTATSLRDSRLDSVVASKILSGVGVRRRNQTFTRPLGRAKSTPIFLNEE